MLVTAFLIFLGALILFFAFKYYDFNTEKSNTIKITQISIVKQIQGNDVIILKTSLPSGTLKHDFQRIRIEVKRGKSFQYCEENFPNIKPIIVSH